MVTLDSGHHVIIPHCREVCWENFEMAAREWPYGRLRGSLQFGGEGARKRCRHMTELAWLFPYLLFLHILGAIAGFGPSFAFPIIGAMGGAEREHGNFATRISETISGRLVYPIGITLPITGAVMILVLGLDLTSKSNWWLGVAIVLYIIAYGYSFFVQRKTVERVVELTSAPPPPGASGPPPELMGLVKRIQRGGMGLTVLLLAIIFLMVREAGPLIRAATLRFGTPGAADRAPRTTMGHRPIARRPPVRCPTSPRPSPTSSSGSAPPPTSTATPDRRRSRGVPRRRHPRPRLDRGVRDRRPHRRGRPVADPRGGAGSSARGRRASRSCTWPAPAAR